MKTIDTIRAIIDENHRSGSGSYDGLTSAEIGAYNRALMFGENDEAFPDAEEWARIVD